MEREEFFNGFKGNEEEKRKRKVSLGGEVEEFLKG